MSIKTLQRGSKGQKVKDLQDALVRGEFLDKKYLVGAGHGTYGPKTVEAVERAQRHHGLVVDGIAGERTLRAVGAIRGLSKCEWALKESDLKAAAKELDVPVALIKAFSEVESRGQSFFTKDGKQVPAMLFERHIMRRRLLHRNLNLLVEIAHKERPDLVNSLTGGYRGGLHEVTRLYKAMELNPDSALESASYGRYQIMGFHWESLGYSSVQEFYDKMSKNEGEHLVALTAFIKVNKALHNAMKKKDWREIARRYNGPAYEKNDYHNKLEQAYNRFLNS